MDIVVDILISIRLEPGGVSAAIVSVYPFILDGTLFVALLNERDDSIFSLSIGNNAGSSSCKLGGCTEKK